MHTTFKASAMIDAMGKVSMVEARPLTTAASSAAYLIHCYHRDSKPPRAHLYPRSDDMVVPFGRTRQRR
jgi:hypothetical protein